MTEPTVLRLAERVYWRVRIVRLLNGRWDFFLGNQVEMGLTSQPPKFQDSLFMPRKAAIDGADPQEPSYWSGLYRAIAVIYCLYVVLALIDLRRHGVSTGFFEIGSWFWGAFPARGCAFQYHMIIHYLPLIYHWSYMVYHWNVPQGLCRSAKLIGRALAFHVFSLANHISPWSNSRAVASGRGPRKMMREKRKRCPWKWAWAAACWRDCLLDHNFNSWKEQVLELFHGTMSHFGSKHVSSDCYSSITTLKVPHLFDQRISWDRRHPLSWCHMKTMDHEWRRCLSWTWHVCHGHVEVYHTETIGGRSHSLLSGPSPGSQSPTNTPALGAGDPWLQYSAAVHSPSWNPVVKQTDIDQQKSDLLTCEVIRSTDTLKGNPQISTTEKYPQKKRLWLDIHHCRSAKIAGTSRTKSPFRLRAVGRSLA